MLTAALLTWASLAEAKAALDAATPAGRAIAFLSREVPQW